MARIDKVNLDELEEYRSFLYLQRKQDGEPLQLSTQRTRLMAVTGLFKRLDMLGVYKSELHRHFILPRVVRRIPVDIPDEAEVEQVMHQALAKGKMGLRDRTILEVYYATGIRRAELANLDVRDVDFKQQVISVSRGKGGRDRMIPIAPRALDWIKKYLKHLRPELLTLESGEALFIGVTGKRIQKSKLTELVGEYVRRPCIGKVGACHLFRHATATHMLRNGADIRYVQEMLGHLDIASTQIYAHVVISDLKRVYAETHPAART